MASKHQDFPLGSALWTAGTSQEILASEQAQRRAQRGGPVRSVLVLVYRRMNMN